MDAEEARTISAQLRRIRNARDKSLVVIAGLAGMSKSHLSRLERGERILDSRAEIVALANALQVAPSELVKLPFPAPGDGSADAAVAAVRGAIQDITMGMPNGRAQSVEQLSARVRAVLEAKQRCRAVSPLPASQDRQVSELDVGQQVKLRLLQRSAQSR